MSVVRPRAELERAGLNVEREMSDVDWTRTEEDGLRDPEDGAVVVEDSHRLAVLLKPRVRAAVHRSA